VDNSPSRDREFAPPEPQNHANFAPPIENKKTPYGSVNTREAPGSRKPAGVFSKPEKTGRGERPPTLHDIELRDLKEFSRTEMLYQEAVRKDWIRDSEANFLNWVAAAVRAKTVKARDPVRVFSWIVRRNAWHMITQEQEERARKGIARHRRRSGRECPIVEALLQAA
jgi:hypothetical protein